jgi:hypothetical protein
MQFASTSKYSMELSVETCLTWCGVIRRGCWIISRVAGSAIIYTSDFGAVMARQSGDILCVLNTLSKRSVINSHLHPSLLFPGDRKKKNDYVKRQI